MRVFGFSGRSGSGKTTLIEKLIPLFRDAGLRVSVVKHAHKGFDMDRPGKDSFRFREAGACEVMISSAHRWALLGECHESHEADSLDSLLARMATCDLVLVEGFRAYPLPRIEVYRPTQAQGQPLLALERQDILAIACDGAIETSLPRLDLNAPSQVARFVAAHLRLPWSGLAREGAGYHVALDTRQSH